ncbi:MAG: tryptophan 7-halogenase [Deltaproteobacteria bacterium]|nr:tryptophan 7-halogenase [Deltaproteobacteria bacterium]
MRGLRVAIVGAGPAGAAVATLLTREGHDVVLFDDERRPELVVGESLIPAGIPPLRRLGVEDAVAAIGMHKPGATLTWSPSHRFAFRFARYRSWMVPYAYNVPRREFDALLLARAEAVGARRLTMRAGLVPGGADGAELALAPDALAATGWPAPDLVVDATGRARVSARLLAIPATTGPRNDVAYFAHFTGWHWSEEPGQVLIDRVEGGWSWRIPLNDRLSLGVVLSRAAAARLGATPEERLAGAIATHDALAATVAGARRTTGVATYGNYQLISTRGVGPGWAAVGDAFGFVDPMLSPGVMVALRSAEMLAARLAPWRRSRDGADPAALATALAPYTRELGHLLGAWMELVGYLYDGRMLALFRAGSDMMTERGGRFAQALQNHIEANIAGLASGTSITSRYSLGLLRFLGRHGLRGVAPEALAIR